MDNYTKNQRIYSEFKIKLTLFSLIFSLIFLAIGYFIISYAFLNFTLAILLISISGYSIGILFSQKIFEKIEINKCLFIKNTDSKWMTKTQALKNKIYNRINERTKFISRYYGWKFKIWNFFLSFVLAEIIFICVVLNLKVAFYNLFEFFPNNSIFEKIERIFKFVFQKTDEFFLKIFNFIGIDLKKKEILIRFAPIIMIFFIILNSTLPLVSNFLKSEQNMHYFLKLYKASDDEIRKEYLLEKIDKSFKKNGNSFEIFALSGLFNEIER